ncbi:hypothetical protein ACLOJK_014856 [Asimina triloba]
MFKNIKDSAWKQPLAARGCLRGLKAELGHPKMPLRVALRTSLILGLRLKATLSRSRISFEGLQQYQFLHFTVGSKPQPPELAVDDRKLSSATRACLRLRSKIFEHWEIKCGTNKATKKFPLQQLKPS